MDRIFTPLASFATLLLLITFVVGLGLQAGDVGNVKDTAIRSWFRIHFLLGIVVGVVVVLVNSIAVTYFIGTGRWCREVVETYKLDSVYVRRSNQLKRQAFPFALINMLLIVGVLALGGAADPASGIRAVPPGGGTWATWHLLGAIVTSAAVGYGFFHIWYYLRENRLLIAEVMAEVARVRGAKG